MVKEIKTFLLPITAARTELDTQVNAALAEGWTLAKLKFYPAHRCFFVKLTRDPQGDLKEALRTIKRHCKSIPEGEGCPSCELFDFCDREWRHEPEEWELPEL